MRAAPKIHFFEEGLLEVIISKGNVKLGLRDLDLLSGGRDGNNARSNPRKIRVLRSVYMLLSVSPN